MRRSAAGEDALTRHASSVRARNVLRRVMSMSGIEGKTEQASSIASAPIEHELIPHANAEDNDGEEEVTTANPATPTVLR